MGDLLVIFLAWVWPALLAMSLAVWAIWWAIFADKALGALSNIEIERSTQVFVDTVRDAIDARLGPLLPALEALLAQQGRSLEELAAPPATLPRT